MPGKVRCPLMIKGGRRTRATSGGGGGNAFGQLFALSCSKFVYLLANFVKISAEVRKTISLHIRVSPGPF